MVENAEQVLSYFGYWPEFCDAKIESFFYSKTGTIDLCIFYIDLNLEKSAKVNLRFNGVSEIALDKLSSENVVDKISFEGAGPFIVTIEGCYGLEGNFKSKSIEVVNFTAKDYIAGVRY